jgi:hypothetical protein
MDHDDEIRELLSNSFPVRDVNANKFVALTLFRILQPTSATLAEYLQLFDFRLQEVTWKAAPPYSVLLLFIAESGHRYFVTTAGVTTRLYGAKIDAEHLFGEWDVVDWQKVAAALLKTEFGQYDQISLFNVPLVCPAVPEIGSGYRSKLALLELQRRPTLRRPG